MEINNYEVITNHNRTIIALNKQIDLNIHTFKELYFGKTMNIRTINDEIIHFPKMKIENENKIKKERLILIAIFDELKLIDAVEIKVLRS